MILVSFVYHRGIPMVSQDRASRMEAIAQQLTSGAEHYHFVFLQEVWSKDDYYFLADKVIIFFLHVVRYIW